MARSRSQLGAFFEAAYGGTRVSLDVLMAEIQAQAGSGRKAAALVGVGETTWRRWRSGGTTPKVENLAKVGSAVRQVRADTKPFNPGGFTIKTKGRDDRQRTITGGQLKLDAVDGRRIDRAYAAGGGDAAAVAFIAAVKGHDDWYGDYLDDLLYEDADYGDEDAYSAGAVGGGGW